MGLFEYCQELRQTRQIGDYFPQYRAADVEAALERLWSKHLVFRTPEECVSLASLRSRGEDTEEGLRSTRSQLQVIRS